QAAVNPEIPGAGTERGASSSPPRPDAPELPRPAASRARPEPGVATRSRGQRAVNRWEQGSRRAVVRWANASISSLLPGVAEPPAQHDLKAHRNLGFADSAQRCSHTPAI